MSSFLAEYWNGEPVCVMDAKGKTIGLPAGFIVAKDGVSWADDSVLQDMPTTPGYHHLYGEVQVDGNELICGGYRFAPASPVDIVLASAWNGWKKSNTDWMAVHDRVEYDLRRDRSLQSIAQP